LQFLRLFSTSFKARQTCIFHLLQENHQVKPFAKGKPAGFETLKSWSEFGGNLLQPSPLEDIYPEPPAQRKKPAEFLKAVRDAGPLSAPLGQG
jgi:hypothetical protein